ncbi:MAG: heme response regulator HssR [Bacillales bacterium]|nr:heme response regulator HssR [Bacillales bacterium]
MIKILVVEDNESVQKLMNAYLKREGYQVLLANDGVEALAILDHEQIDLLISDIMMPRMDGYSLTENLRSTGFDMPILMITAKDRIEDKKKGFRLGTDDYMVKPIDFDEMVLRVTALLRRAKISKDKKISIGEVTADYDSLTVYTPGKNILLPQKEFLLLFKLMSYPNKTFTRFDLMEEIWGMDSETDERTVDVHIRRLREKFADRKEFSIITVRGLGYRIERVSVK